MAKGEYEFPILVTCLLILALQIHNPFQTQRQSSCRCDEATGAASVTSTVGRQSAGTQPSSRRGQQQATPDPPSPTAYRKAVAPNTGAGAGLSSDALLRELNSIQEKAKEQQETLAAVGRMPPPSEILEHLKRVEATEEAMPSAVGRGSMPTTGMAAPTMPTMQPAGPSAMGGAAIGGGGRGFGAEVASSGDGAAMLRRRDDMGRFLEARQPRGLGVVLGIGRGDFALRLLADWGSSQGLYMIDPFIHIWRGYNDPANLQDKDHQVVFEDLRQRLQPYEGRYMLVRDFSHSFAETFRRSSGPASFIYIDANHAEQAITRDLELWWPQLQPGGLLAGSTYMDDNEGNIRVRSVVENFVARQGLQLHLTHDDSPPSWYVFKP